jgi:hypothetical protein
MEEMWVSYFLSNSLPFLRLGCAFKGQGKRVNTVALTRGPGAVGKDMAQVGITLTAQYFYSVHTVTAVGFEANILGGFGRPEAGPA